MKIAAIFLFLILLALAISGTVSRTRKSPPEVKVDMRGLKPARKADTLYVLVHGLNGENTSPGWRRVADKLQESGDVAVIRYASTSNASPSEIAANIDKAVQQVWEKRRYPDVRLVGYSMGALLSRKAFLYSAGGVTGSERTRAGDRWSDKLTRLVMLAGMNRGWDLSGQKPADMRWHTHVQYSVAAWLASLTGQYRLFMSMEAGSPFVADLRMEWMRWFQDGKGKLEVVQLLGDIDEVVSAEDDQDLRVAASRHFAWIKVRGTGHTDILKFENELEPYRFNKVMGAIQHNFADLQAHSEQLPYQTDDKVRKVVFIIHGIRDLGEWSSTFETTLRTKFNGTNGDRLAIASVRYGYFGMGQFLLRTNRQKYVRWFMDQYTETLARYPNATEIDVIAHSNGTYLLTNALAQYSAMKIRRAVLAGSVVRKEFDWHKVFERDQVKVVRNYVADDDWVVGLFPRFFELPATKWMGNDVGSAGFSGFDQARPEVRRWPIHNVQYISGHHSAFRQRAHVDGIADYLISADPTRLEIKDTHPETRWPALQFTSKYLSWAVYLLLAIALFWIGSRVAGAAGERGWIALFMYLLLVTYLLRWV